MKRPWPSWHHWPLGGHLSWMSTNERKQTAVDVVTLGILTVLILILIYAYHA